MKERSHRLIFIIPILVIFTFSACNKKQEVRKYQEKSNPVESIPSTIGKQEVSSAKLPGNFIWEIPEDWQEIKSNSKIRLASFLIKDNGQDSLCTIILLQGQAGSLKANIERWLVQISKSADKIKTNTELLLNQKEAIVSIGKFNGFFIDYTIVTKNPEDSSILVSILRVDSNSVFIKLVGPKSSLLKNMDKFKNLCQSFRKGKK